MDNRPAEAVFVSLINRARNTDEFLRRREGQLCAPDVRRRLETCASRATADALAMLDADPSLVAYIPR
jgi:hypothetical protein